MPFKLHTRLSPLLTTVIWIAHPSAKWTHSLPYGSILFCCFVYLFFEEWSFKGVTEFMIHISKFFIHLDVYLYPIHWPAPSWLVSSIGRALHRYRRGHGFKSRTGLNFFQVLFTTTSFSSVLGCEDLLIS